MNIFSLCVCSWGCAEKNRDTGSSVSSATQSVNESSTEPSSPTGEPTENPASEPNSTPTSDPASEVSTEPSSSASDSGDSLTTCTANDLGWVAQIRTSTGETTAFQSADDLSIVALIENPCTEDYLFSTTTTCLVSQALLQSNSGTGNFFHQPTCGRATTDWVVPGGGSVEEVIVVGTRPADTYMLELSFADPGVHSASLFFTVDP